MIIDNQGDDSRLYDRIQRILFLPTFTITYKKDDRVQLYTINLPIMATIRY